MKISIYVKRLINRYKYIENRKVVVLFLYFM